MKAILSTEIELEIPFHDVDSMGITWHGNYLRYFEIARCKLLDRFDYGYSRMQESGYAWPIVDLQLKYVKPSRFEQKIRVSAALVEWENRLKINYQICDATNGERLTKGYTIQAAVDMQTQELCLVTPPVFRERLTPFIATAEAKP
ncbi:acyl-CoA thioesterase [Shewanella algae]|uniref:Acyl-CoA thioesterase YbgC n=1 Tax=Shewanella algae TaxID=38313 RepID=A0A379ZUS7_9GAMM|nr:acyl-CoA thioesterase [Shewanella algae]MBO2609535.1 acyl-CoA thioesterase [Shewanella algae]BCV26440.1 thioesterase [Shewanella algae]SUI68447.1 acyl-CoA thioesterase YbgC [Shewanella algae]